MDRAGRHALLGALVLAVLTVASWRDRPAARDGGRRPTVSPDRGTVAPAPPASAVRTAPAGSLESMIAHLQQGNCPPLSKDVLSGPLAVEGSGRTDLAVPDLALTPSQRTLVEALLRERNATFDSIRREAESAPQTRESAAVLASKASRAHDACLESIRGCLLPDQRSSFDELIRTNRWGGYALVIPTSR